MAPVPSKTFRENDELVSDLARFSEGVLTEKQIRKKWHLLDESVWDAIGEDDIMVEMVEAEQVRRIRNGAAKREKAQLHVVRAPDVLEKIMSDPKANARHRIDSARALDSLAGFVSERPAFDQDRVIIRIDLGADVRAQGLAPDPKDAVVIEAEARPVDGEGRFVAPQERAPMNSRVEQFEQEVIPEKRGPGRPRGSKSKSKVVDEPRCAGFHLD